MHIMFCINDCLVHVKIGITLFGISSTNITLIYETYLMKLYLRLTSPHVEAQADKYTLVYSTTFITWPF